MKIRPYKDKSINELALIISNNEENEDILLNVRYELDLCWESSAKGMIGEIDKLLSGIYETSKTGPSGNNEFNDKFRELGIDPKTGLPIIVRIGRNGPVAQLGSKGGGKKPKYATIRKGSDIETITLEEVLRLFELPRILGEWNNSEVIKANYGRFGPYLQYGDKKYVELKDENDTPEEIDLERALELIVAKEKADKERIIKVFKGSEIQILNSHRGPNIWNGIKGKGRKNITIAKFFGDRNPSELTLNECKKAINGDVKPLKEHKISNAKKTSFGAIVENVKPPKEYDTNTIIKANVETLNKSLHSDMKRPEIGWEHPIDTSGEYEGFNNASMEHFGDHLKGFAREMTQNSLDAAFDSNQPVILNLKLLDMPVGEIPNLDELKSNLQMALDTHNTMSKNPNKKVSKFFANALSLLNGRSIKVFEFSDFNTTGMTSGGDKDLDNTFHVYMKTKDFSQKSDESLGSFGIGKSAPYAVSNLRTIITSSVYELNGIATQATQGKSILTTLRSENNDGSYTFRNNNGYWGVKEGATHISGYVDGLSPHLQRIDVKNSKASLGSKVSVLGFAFCEDWKERMAYAIIQNFFASINSGKLIVNIGNNAEYVLNSGSIQRVKEFIDSDIVAKYDDEFIESLDIRMSYLEAINGKSRSLEKTLSHLGLCRIELAISEGLPKKVCFIRDGMFITDELSINKLKQFSEFNDFVVVFQCLNKKGNLLLRDMEPPAHNTFEVSRLSGNSLEGKKALNEVATWIRDELKKYAYDQVEKTAFVNELEEFFNYDMSEGDSGKDAINEINPFSDVTIKLKPTPKKQTKRRKVTKDENGEDVEIVDPFGDGAMIPDNMGTGSGGGDMSGLSGTSIEKSRISKPTNVNNFRFLKLTDGSIRMFFDHSRSKKLKIEVFLSGVDEDMKLLILDSNLGEVHNGDLYIDVTSKERNSINLVLDSYSYGSLKVEAHEI
ncbi:MAG: hypothetical protein ISR69_07920 [Gammaproteobacteria bacterium]|nr:hypothetical protein [Gammaproteobacteria bacterium]